MFRYEVPVLLLRLFNFLNEVVCSFVERGVTVLLVRKALDSLPDLRLPEEMLWHGPGERPVVGDWVPFQIECIIPPRGLEHVQLESSHYRDLRLNDLDYFRSLG